MDDWGWGWPAHMGGVPGRGRRCARRWRGALELAGEPLAGLVQAPSFYDPTVHLAAAERRQLASEARRLGFRTVRGG